MAFNEQVAGMLNVLHCVGQSFTLKNSSVQMSVVFLLRNMLIYSYMDSIFFDKQLLHVLGFNSHFLFFNMKFNLRFLLAFLC